MLRWWLNATGKLRGREGVSSLIICFSLALKVKALDSVLSSSEEILTLLLAVHPQQLKIRLRWRIPTPPVEACHGKVKDANFQGPEGL